MNFRAMLFLGLLIVCAHVKAEPHKNGYQFDATIVYKTGDNPEWATKHYDHSNWQRYDVNTPVHHNGIIWIRFGFTVNNAKNNPFPQAIIITSLMSYELYLDGQLFMLNGKVGATKEQEIKGLRQARTILPQNLLSDGHHVLAFRLSAHHLQQRNPYYEHMNLLLKQLQISDYKGGSQIRQFNKFMVLALSLVSLIVGVYFLILFFADRHKKAFVLLGALCICIFVGGVLLNLIWLYNYPYDWHYYKWWVAVVMGNLVLFLMPSSFLHLFDLKHKNRWFYSIVVIFFVCLVLAPPKLYGLWIIVGALGLSIAIHGFAIKKQSEVAMLSLIGLLLCTVVALIDFDYFYSTFVMLIIFVLARTTIMQRRQRELFVLTKLQAVQLEAELLRKNIQPHFILNSLTALMEWVETEPDKSVDFIAELADEFRLFAEVVGEDQIAVGKEIDICNKHLAIMAFRLGGRFELQSSGCNGDELIPPAVFHSLIENAFSHNDYANAQVDFELTRVEQDNAVIWSLSVPVRQTKTDNTTRIGAGFGTTYIESRLQQSYPDKWAIEALQRGERWVTEISILE